MFRIFETKMTNQRENKWPFEMESSTNLISPTPQLSSQECLSLAQIINAFQTPITEEFAWALCYQLAKCGQRILAGEGTRRQCLLLTSSAQLLIHKDGIVHTNSFLSPNSDDDEADVKDGESRLKCSQERKLISNMAVVIFLALDYGLPGDLERIISPDLETLLEEMLSPDVPSRTDFRENDDRKEGQGGDYQGSNCNFSRIIQTCAHRMRKLCMATASREPGSVDGCYKATCRTYVAEALELYTFLEKVANFSADPDLRLDLPYQGSGSEIKENVNLSNVGFIDWARHWSEVIRDLRKGVKLKKAFCRYQPIIPPELTPYEILMEDIRSRRYKLKKVVTEEYRPENDPQHALILELIGSTPPRLRKAADRILNPPPTIEPTPVEKLMTSIIRQEHSLSKVKLPEVDSVED